MGDEERSEAPPVAATAEHERYVADDDHLNALGEGEVIGGSHQRRRGTDDEEGGSPAPGGAMGLLYEALPSDSEDLIRIAGAQRSTSEQLDCATATLSQFNNESARLLTSVSDSFAAHTVTIMELNKAVAQLEQRVIRTKQRAMRLAVESGIDVDTLLPERDDDV